MQNVNWIIPGLRKNLGMIQLNPEFILRNGFHVENCGYLIKNSFTEKSE